MAAHRMEFPTQSEISTNYEAEHIPDPNLQRQLGRASLEGLRLASPVETHPFAELETSLKQSIIGQPDAIESILCALNRENFRNPNRPIANLLFLGPTGVGKSETAKELARLLHGDDESAFLKIDCSDFELPHSIGILTGAPPSYVGREQKPLLDPEIIEQNKSIVLFDEIEKGSQPLYDLMLQIMDDGEVTLSNTGQKVSFKNSIIIMTSNLGSTEMMSTLNPKRTGFQLPDADKAQATKHQINKAANSSLERFFRPEFINRIDQRVVFNPLNDEQYGEILSNYVANANEEYRNLGINLTITPDLTQRLVTGTDDRQQFGARPILRSFDRMVASNLAIHVNTGSIPKGSNVYAVLSEDNTTDEVYDYGKDINFYFECNPALMPKPKTKEVVIVASEAVVEEVSEAA